MLSYVRRAVDHYNMIKEGDRVAVGRFGRQGLARPARRADAAQPFLSRKFEVVAITLEMGYDEMDFSPVQALCDRLGVEYIRVPTQIGPDHFRHSPRGKPLCAVREDAPRRAARGREGRRLQQGRPRPPFR